MKYLSLQGKLDLFIYLQRPSKSNSWLRAKIQPILNEQFISLSQQQLESYFKKIINIESTTPNNDKLTVVQCRNILDFINQQPNLIKVHSQIIYQLVEKVIRDSKSGGNEFASKVMEKHRIDQ